MKIQCKHCHYSEETSMDLFIKIIGGVLPTGGFYAWVTYFFAGTGLALPIVIAMITGGVALLAFQNEIVTWVCDQNYTCPNCEHCEWESIS